jgi:hypothetical protein
MPKNFSYWGLLGRAWTDFTKNLILFLPLLIGLVFIIGFFIVMIIELGLLILTNPVLLDLIRGIAIADPSIILPIITQPTFIILGILFAIIDFFLLILITAYVRGMHLGMYDEIMRKGVTSTQTMFAAGKKYFKVYFAYSLWKFLIVFLPALLLLIILGLIALASPIVAGILAIIFLILFILYALFIGILLFFMDPIIASKKDRAWNLIRYSFSYFFKNAGHVVITVLIVIVVALVVGMAFGLVLLPLEMAAAVFPPLIVLTTFLRTIINWALSLVIQAYIFRSYYTYNNIK